MRRRSTWKTRPAPPPLTERPAAAGPAIETGPVVLLSSSWPWVSVMVVGLEKTLASKAIAGAAGQDVGEVDRLTEAELTEGRADAVDRAC